MSFLDRMLNRREKNDQPEAQPPVPEVENEDHCPHTALAPHWEEFDDMGKKELATYTCESCGRAMDYDEAQHYLDQPPPVLTGMADEATPEPYDDGKQ